MRRDVFHYYPTGVKETFDAYFQVLSAKPFKKKPSATPYSLIAFGIGFSFKYNMNGGGVHVHFAPQGSGTAVQIRFSIAQLMGARYRAYDNLMTQKVEERLHVKAEPIDALPESFFNEPLPDGGSSEDHSSRPSESPAERLRQAKDMLDAGLITQEEYDILKKKILESM